ncbi:hypothetical protein ACILE2_01090 [Capnocytophaga canimorsus]|uniref:hypothetical protein n=1 Tax=Capnocytophaga canimorsus TaxID=28188 RepID=UPI0037CF37F5
MKTAKNPKGSGRKPFIKPTIEEFQALAKKLKGNKTAMAESLGISFPTIDKWCKEVPEFQEAISHQTEKRLDGYLDVAHILAMGIPDKENGKIVGWRVPPDAGTLRFMIEKYGVRRGLVDKLDITSNGNNINTGFKIEVIDKREDVRTEQEEEN